jgi:hypothetical protein
MNRAKKLLTICAICVFSVMAFSACGEKGYDVNVELPPCWSDADCDNHSSYCSIENEYSAYGVCARGCMFYDKLTIDGRDDMPYDSCNPDPCREGSNGAFCNRQTNSCEYFSDHSGMTDRYAEECGTVDVPDPTEPLERRYVECCYSTTQLTAYRNAYGQALYGQFSWSSSPPNWTAERDLIIGTNGCFSAEIYGSPFCTNTACYFADVTVGNHENRSASDVLWLTDNVSEPTCWIDGNTTTTGSFESGHGYPFR